MDQTLLESPEKKRESRMIAPKSAIGEHGDDQLAERRVALAGVGEHRDPMPSGVVDKMIATGSGACMRPGG